MTEFQMPSLGADMEAGTLAEWLVKPGDQVKRGDIIAVVDTQKGLIDIEVFEDGTVSELLIKENEKVPVGTVMALFAADNESQKKKEEQATGKKIEEKKETQKVIVTEIPHGVKASPLAKRIAAEKGIDLTTVKGTGEEGAITRDDVERAITERVAPIEEKKTGVTENIRMAVAAAMSKSNREIPHYYLETKADMSKALSWLSETNKQRTVKQRLLPVVLLIKAVAKALTEVPELNGYWENGLQKNGM